MAVCSFLGHDDVYDVDLKFRLKTAIERVANENELVEFLLHPNYEEDFFTYCFLAAVEVRNQCPDKVNITLILHKNQQCRCAPASMFDEVVYPQLPEKKGRDNTMSYKKIKRWILKNSTHIINCAYEKLHDPDVQFLKLKNYNKLEIINATNPETEKAIIDSVSLMTEREQIVVHMINEGYTLKEVGAMLGVSQERVRQILQHGCRKLRENMRQRYNKLRYVDSLERVSIKFFK